MKKFFYFTTMVIISIGSSCRENDATYLPESSKQTRFLPVSKTIYEYSQHGNYFICINFEYDTQGRLTRTLRNLDGYIDTLAHNVEYSPQSREICFNENPLYVLYIGYDNPPTPYRKIIYNEAGDPIRWEGYFDTDSLSPSSIHKYIYDDKQKLIGKKRYGYYNSTEHLISEYRNFIYDNNGNLLSFCYYDYAGYLIRKILFHYTYNDRNQMINLKITNTNSNITDEYTTFKYDSYGNLIYCEHYDKDHLLLRKILYTWTMKELNPATVFYNYIPLETDSY